MIACISDTHSYLPDPEMFEGIHTLVHAGDIGPDFHVQSWVNATFVPWFEELKRRNIEFVGTYGNHDFPSKWGREFSAVIPWGPTKIAQKSAWCSAYSPKFFDWAWMLSEDRLYEYYQGIPEDVEILVSHTPPKGGAYGTMANGDDVGSTALAAWLNERPQCHTVICGHIHEGWGRYTLPSGQRIINAAYCDEYYTPMHRFQRVTIS